MRVKGSASFVKLAGPFLMGGTPGLNGAASSTVRCGRGSPDLRRGPVPRGSGRATRDTDIARSGLPKFRQHSLKHPSIRHRGRAARDHVGGDHHGSSSVDRSGRNRVRQLRGRTFIKSERQ